MSELTPEQIDKASKELLEFLNSPEFLEADDES